MTDQKPMSEEGARMTDQKPRNINLATVMLRTKDDIAAFCPVHIPMIEASEISVGRSVPVRELTTVPVPCAMCQALDRVDNGGTYGD